uniref:SET domain-containing protein n=1 Tax=Trichogramma kaykai TaxID=54128 RepID=A0ABD2WBA8_9HYME
MNYHTLCNLDDLTKTVVIDSMHNYKLRRMKPNRTMPVNKLNHIKLYFQLHLKFFHGSSNVKLAKYSKYANNDYDGVKVVATENLVVGQVLKYVFGIYKIIPPSEKYIMDDKRFNFSLLYTTQNQDTSILLGPIAYINHDCSPNSEFKSSGKSSTINIKIIKNIKQGEELFVKYSGNYFGEDNIDCQCDTCFIKNSNLPSNKPDESIGFQTAVIEQGNELAQVKYLMNKGKINR